MGFTEVLLVEHSATHEFQFPYFFSKTGRYGKATFCNLSFSGFTD